MLLWGAFINVAQKYNHTYINQTFKSCKTSGFMFQSTTTFGQKVHGDRSPDFPSSILPTKLPHPMRKLAIQALSQNPKALFKALVNPSLT